MILVLNLYKMIDNENWNCYLKNIYDLDGIPFYFSSSGTVHIQICMVWLEYKLTNNNDSQLTTDLPYSMYTIKPLFMYQKGQNPIFHRIFYVLSYIKNIDVIQWIKTWHIKPEWSLFYLWELNSSCNPQEVWLKTLYKAQRNSIGCQF
jgi:hypothetical protein